MKGAGESTRPPKPTDDDVKDLERALAKTLRSHCPPPHTLGEYRLSLLSKAREAQVARHVQACPLCEAEMGLLAGFLQDGDESAEPQGSSAGERPSMREQLARWGDALESLLGGANRRGMPVPAGLRGASGETLAPHQASPVETGASMGLTFPTDDGMVALQARSGPKGRYDLLVLVTPLEGGPGNLPVWLRRGTTAVASARTDLAGNAVFTGLPAGTYDLAVQHGTFRFWVKGIRLGPGTDATEEEADAPTP